MKIRTQITISFLAVIIVITLSMFYVSISTIDKFSRLNVQSTKNIIEAVTEENLRVSEDILLSYSKKIIKIESRSLAREISQLLSALKKNYTYYDIRANSKLRAIATKNIYSLNKDVGYFTVVDRRGESVLHPKESIEAKKLSEMENEYSAMWELLRDSFRKDETQKEFTDRNKNNEEYRKFMFVTSIPDSRFKLCAVVNMNYLFKQVYSKIEKAGMDAQKNSEEIRCSVLAEMKKHYIKVCAVYAVLILALGITYGLLFGSYISRPIARLQKAIDDLQQGKMPEKLREYGSSETKKATQSFNDMTTMLKKEDVQEAFRRAGKR